MKKDRIRSFRSSLRRFQRLISAQLKEDSCCCGVTLPQCHVLLEIEEMGETTLVELASNLSLDKSTLSRTVDGLVNTGLVKRVSHPTDRRFTLIALSEQGKEVCSSIHSTFDDFFSAVFESIPGEKREGVIDCFELLVSAFLKHKQGYDERLGCSSSCTKK